LYNKNNSSSSSQATHDGISGAGNVDGMLVTIVGLGLLRFTLPGGVGAGRSGIDAEELTVAAAAAGRWPTPTLQHTQLYLSLHPASPTVLHTFTAFTINQCYCSLDSLPSKLILLIRFTPLHNWPINR